MSCLSNTQAVTEQRGELSSGHGRTADQNQRQSEAMGHLKGTVAMVTGAGGGIGRAIALALAAEGATVCASGRNLSGLQEVLAEARPAGYMTALQADLTIDEDMEMLSDHLSSAGKLDILIHAAGAIHQGQMQHARIEDLDLQYATNVRAPYVLTKRLLPLLAASCGQIVFINSSAGLNAKRADAGQYAATKHALRAVADSLREEVNSKGVRVLSVYLGRTATPMQEAVCRQEGKEYRPDLLVQPGDVASVILTALVLPRTAEITDISIRPMRKPC